MEKLQASGEYTFFVSQAFQHRFLEPAGHFVLWKLTHAWDDDNELAHASRLFELLLKNDSLAVDSHLMMKGEDLKGALFIVRGALEAIESRYPIGDTKKSLILKYFHIMERGRGIGQHWLKQVVMPYYSKAGFADIYLSSSHPKSFGFYEKFGKEIASYTTPSDNGLLMREGKCFRISLSTG